MTDDMPAQRQRRRLFGRRRGESADAIEPASPAPEPAPEPEVEAVPDDAETAGTPATTAAADEGSPTVTTEPALAAARAEPGPDTATHTRTSSAEESQPLAQSAPDLVVRPGGLAEVPEAAPPPPDAESVPVPGSPGDSAPRIPQPVDAAPVDGPDPAPDIAGRAEPNAPEPRAEGARAAVPEPESGEPPAQSESIAPLVLPRIIAIAN